jgi:hypothetical protein
MMNDQVQIMSLDGKSISYSPVIALPHAKGNRKEVEFVSLVTESGRELKLTADHLIFAGVCGMKFSLLEAALVNVNACLFTIAGEERVVSVSVVKGRGVYTAVTLNDGLLVVNGVAASPFAVNHGVANSFYNIHRFIYKFFPSMSTSSLLANIITKFGDIVIEFSG